MENYKNYICKDKKCSHSFRSKSKNPYCPKCHKADLEKGGKRK